MADLLIKDFPPELYRRLKKEEEAASYHRSMTRQALVLQKQALSTSPRNTAGLLREPLRTPTALAADNVLAVIRENRESDELNRLK